MQTANAKSRTCPVRDHLVRKYAVQASVHPTTMRKFFMARDSVLPMVRERIERALRELGVDIAEEGGR